MKGTAFCAMHVPHARDKLVFDRYHNKQHLGKGVSGVRKQKHKAVLRHGVTLG